jgi:hypothetical protein
VASIGFTHQPKTIFSDPIVGSVPEPPRNEASQRENMPRATKKASKLDQSIRPHKCPLIGLTHEHDRATIWCRAISEPQSLCQIALQWLKDQAPMPICPRNPPHCPRTKCTVTIEKEYPTHAEA